MKRVTRSSTHPDQGTIAFTYDAAGRPLTQAVNGSVMATATYDSGELATVTYNSGVSQVLTYDNAGRLNSRTYTKAGTTISSDAATYSRSGKRITATSDASGANWTYGYDGAGRLTTAGVSMGAASDNFTYSYGPATCGEPTAGAGGNITRRQSSGATIDYCYDRADRLTTMKFGGLDWNTTHDNRGNQLTLGHQNYTYDAADRATGISQNGAGAATYTRDGANRIIARTVSGSAIQFSFANGSDAPVAAYGTTGALLERYVGLLGGVMVRTTVLAGSGAFQTSLAQ